MRGPAVLVCLFSLTLAACGRAPTSVIGHARVGAALMGQAQCGACHAIPGIAAANGMSGPPLKGFAGRTIIAGMLANTPDNLVAWLRAPQTISPGNAMPNMNLSDAQAHDIAAYLYTLQ